MVHTCSDHDFESESYDEYKEHLKTTDHTTVMGGICAMCHAAVENYQHVGKYDIDDQPVMICDACKRRIAGEMSGA